MKKYIAYRTDSGIRTLQIDKDWDRIANSDDCVKITNSDLAKMMEITPYRHEWDIVKGKLVKASENVIKDRLNANKDNISILPKIKKNLLTFKQKVALSILLLGLVSSSIYYCKTNEITIYIKAGNNYERTINF